MSLRLKFAMLLGLAGSALLLALVVSVWSVVQLSQQIGRPFVGLASSMIERQEIERCLDMVEEAASRGDSDGATEAAGDASRRAAELAAMGWFDSGIGSRTAEVLRDGLIQLSGAIQTAGVAGGGFGFAEADSQRIAELLEMLRSLLQRLESRLLDDATLALAHADRLPQDLLVVVVAAAVLGALVLSLGLVLLQRWMLAPVGRLRRAAERIGKGDFKHRIPVSGKDELATLSAEVNHMAETIERLLDERLDQERLAAIGGMVRRLAHNLRNPLAGIRGLAELTRAELDEHHTEARAHQQRIIESVDRFERWLSDLLNVSSPTAYRPGMHEPENWLRGVVRVCEPSAEGKGVRVEFCTEGCPDSAVFDAAQLEQAVIAVVSNAVEASSAGGMVTVLAGRPDKASGPDDVGPGWMIRVTDERPGIPEALREKVFGAYFTTKPDGKGIGLAVAQQIVQSHGGRIEVCAGHGGVNGKPGTSIRIWLPLRDMIDLNTIPMSAARVSADGPAVRV